MNHLGIHEIEATLLGKLFLLTFTYYPAERDLGISASISIDRLQPDPPTGQEDRYYSLAELAAKSHLDRLISLKGADEVREREEDRQAGY